MTPLETVPWERLVWDTNRLRKGAQRQFHASAQERAGASTTVTERAARELAPFMTPHRLEDALERAYDAHRSPDTVAEDLARAGVRNPRGYLRMNIWWAEEWLRSDSPYNVRILSDDERARANELLWNLVLEQTAARHGLALPDVAYRDLLPDYRTLRSGVPGRHTLAAACEREGVVGAGAAHRAEGDCRAVLAVLRAVVEAG